MYIHIYKNFFFSKQIKSFHLCENENENNNKKYIYYFKMQNAFLSVRWKVWFAMIFKSTQGIKENEKSEEQRREYCKKSKKAIITELS